MSARESRIIVMPLRQAWPWRWELALLEIGCRESWRLPGAEALAQRARQIGEILRENAASAALGFEGYTLIGACWRQQAFPCRSVASAWPAFGPFVMPRQASAGLDLRLLAALASSAHAGDV